jgi:hypothetical protein
LGTVVVSGEEIKVDVAGFLISDHREASMRNARMLFTVPLVGRLKRREPERIFLMMFGVRRPVLEPGR